MAAITWQNVDAPHLTDFYKPLAAAGQMMSDSFTGLQDVIKQREATNAANWEQVKTNNFQNDMSSLMSQYNTPQEFQTAKDAGVFNKIIADRGAQTDRVAYQAAVDGRKSILETRQTQGINSENLLRDHNEAKAVDDIGALIGRGNFSEARTAIDSGTYRNESILETALTAARNTATNQKNANSAASFAAQMRPGQMAIQNLSLDAAKLSAETTQHHRRADEIAQEETKKYTGEIDKYRAKLNIATQEMGIPTDTSGAPVLKDLSLNQLNDLKQRLGETPNTSHLVAKLSDSLAKANIPVGIATAMTDLVSKTATNGSVISATALKTVEHDNKYIDQKLADAQKYNPLYRGTPEQEITENNKINGIVKSIKDWGPFTKNNILDHMHGYLNNGVIIPDASGKEVKHDVPPKLLAQILSANLKTDKWWNSTNENVQSALEGYFTGKNYAVDLTGLSKIQADPRGNIAKLERAKATQYGQSVNPTDLERNLMAYIDTASRVSTEKGINNTLGIDKKKVNLPPPTSTPSALDPLTHFMR